MDSDIMIPITHNYVSGYYSETVLSCCASLLRLPLIVDDVDELLSALFCSACFQRRICLPGCLAGRLTICIPVCHPRPLFECIYIAIRLYGWLTDSPDICPPIRAFFRS